jgi:hypothetical protein
MLKIKLLLVLIIVVKSNLTFCNNIHNEIFNNNETKTDSLNISSEQFCRQLNSALDYLIKNEIFKRKIELDKIIRPGWGYSLMLTQYISGKLSIPEEKVWKQNNEIIKTSLVDYNENVAYNDTLLILNVSSCELSNVRKKSKWQAVVSKTDYETLLVYLTYRRNPKVHSSGFVYLFFFNENCEITAFYKTSWIE